MKKFTSLAAALCLATAFSGFCAGCASGITENQDREYKNTSTATSDSGVSVAAEGDNKIILCPGWNYQGSTKTLNTLSGAGVTQMTQTQATDTTLDYWVENAYFFEAAAGTALPTPTAGKSGITFVGWRYANNGALETVSEMPSGGDVMILYAEWQVGNGSIGGGGGDIGGGGSGGGGGSTLQEGDYNLYVNDVLVNNSLLPGTGGGETAPDNLVFNYYATNVSLNAGDTVRFVIKGETISVIWAEQNTAIVGTTASQGKEISGDTVTVSATGVYTVSVTRWEDQVSSNKVNVYIG